jgi:hypothetical protein
MVEKVGKSVLAKFKMTVFCKSQHPGAKKIRIEDLLLFLLFLYDLAIIDGQFRAAAHKNHRKSSIREQDQAGSRMSPVT